MSLPERASPGIAVVVGGAKGIGEATSRLLSEDGWQVVVADIDLEAATMLAEEIGGEARHIDIGSAEGVDAVAEDIERTVGPVVGVANCAAMFQGVARADQTPIAEWDRIMQINLRGTYVVDIAFARRMAPRGKGSIVNVSSINARRPAPMHAYNVSKAGVDSVTLGMAGEWGRSGVRVNAVTPGMTLVERVVDRLKHGSTRYAVSPIDMSALGRLCEPREVAQAIAFLLSDRASGITGANIAADAGMMVAPSWQLYGGVPGPRAAATGE